EFEKLLAIVEPFSFKEKFQMPKYIINAASDEFFVTDSWRFYYNELPGIKLLRYIPNVNHSLDGRYLSNNLIGFYKRIISNETFPDVYWKLENDSIHVNVKSDEKYLVSLWIANNENGRDFRLSEKGQLWRKIEIKNNNIGNYKAKLNNGLKGYTAIMFEFIFKPESKYPLIVTTGPYVTPHSYPYQKEKLDKVYGDH
ncbi:MAG: PhoPQ-activated pathogenicity-like protein PqaA type, partial [Flavobacteriaceae bacterium]|nr:PhoPQ-activated pathogenicity-like protein PqaA type [Flavobacteriaceae bacterium]